MGVGSWCTKHILGGADFGASHAIAIYPLMFLWTLEYAVCSKFQHSPPSVLCYGCVRTCCQMLMISHPQPQSLLLVDYSFEPVFCMVGRGKAGES